MGTSSLVFGLILIGMGLYALIIAETFPETDEEVLIDFVVRLIIAIPSFVVGGILLRKYYRDRKKEKKVS